MKLIHPNPVVVALLLLLTTITSLITFKSHASGMAISYPDSSDRANPRIWTSTLFGKLAAHHTQSAAWNTHVSSNVTGGVSAVNEGNSVERVFFIHDKKLATMSINNGNSSGVSILSNGFYLGLDFEYSNVRAFRSSQGKTFVAAISKDGRLCKWQSILNGFMGYPHCSSPNYYAAGSRIFSDQSRGPLFIARTNDGQIRHSRLINASWQVKKFGLNGRSIEDITLGGSADGSTWVIAKVSDRFWVARFDPRTTGQTFKLLPALPNGQKGYNGVARATKWTPTFNQGVKTVCGIHFTVNAGTSIWTWSASSIRNTYDECNPIFMERGTWSEKKYNAGSNVYVPGVVSEDITSFLSFSPIYGAVFSGWFPLGYSKLSGNQFIYLGNP